MAEELNIQFSSVFTREDTSSLPVPETKFEGSEGERLGQLVVTPEVVANKINNMKENKSPGIDGIAPKILKETIEQICTPLAHVFNMSLQEGIVPLEWKEANIIPLFKKGSRNKSVNYRPVSLTSVIYKVLDGYPASLGFPFSFVITKYQWQGTRCRMVCEYTGYWPMPSSGYPPCSLPSSINPSSARFLPPAVHVHASSRPFLAPSLHQPSLPLFLSPSLPLSLHPSLYPL